MALSACALTSCSFIKNLINKGEQTSIDSTIYGTGAEREQLVVDADIPPGEYVVFSAERPNYEKASVEVYKSSSISLENIYFSDTFENTSMCKLKPGQVVVAKYCTFQNLNSNPEIGDLSDGLFKVGVHFQLKNKVLKLRGIKEEGYGGYTVLKSLTYGVLSVYTHPNLTPSQTIGNLAKDETVSIPYIENGAYVDVDGIEIVVETT